MIVQLLIGALAFAVVAFLYEYSRRNEIALTWWQWGLTILAILYSVFVLEVFVGFLGEGAVQAAVVNGGFTGLFAVIAFVLLGRFVFKKAKEV